MDIQQIKSPNFGYPTGAPGRNGQVPCAIVVHVEAGSEAGTQSWFASPKSQASAHFSISKKGEVTQYVRIEDVAWANGRVQKPDLSVPWLADAVRRGINPNLLTVSIETEGHPTDPDYPTQAQVGALIDLIRHIRDEVRRIYGVEIPMDRQHIVGHYQIDAVDRPYCPGPQMPWQSILTGIATLDAKVNVTKSEPPAAHETDDWRQELVDELTRITLPDGTRLLNETRPATQTTQWWELAALIGRIARSIAK